MFRLDAPDQGAREGGDRVVGLGLCEINLTHFSYLNFQSTKSDQSSGKLNLKFWQESRTIECIQSCIKRLDFHNFRGGQSELTFLKFFFESALVLEEAVIYLDPGFTSMEVVDSKVKILRSMKRRCAASLVLVTGCSDRQGGHTRRFKRGSDFSVRDPFAHYSDAPVCICKTPFQICIQCLKIPSTSGFYYYDYLKS
jgi:hypothetical protein